MPLWTQLLNVFLPRTCPACEEDVPAASPHALCPRCFDSVTRGEAERCPLCDLPLRGGEARCFVCRERPRSFESLRSPGLYEGALEKCLHQLKYGARYYLAHPLGLLLSQAYREFFGGESIDGVIPVPLHFWRKMKRGYNQAELLGGRLAGEIARPLWPRVLRRRRGTRSQVSLSGEERFTNMRRAFEVRAQQRPFVEGKNLLLVDDVCTTGATVDACAAVLKEAGAQSVRVLTVARQKMK